jgi:hypothetical protein
MTPELYPAACRKYAELSPDIYCQAHLANWLEERGRSLLVWADWLHFRLATDNLPLTSPETFCDASMFDNLNCLG